eukprot:282148_1
MLNNRLALLLAFLGALVLGVSGRQDASDPDHQFVSWKRPRINRPKRNTNPNGFVSVKTPVIDHPVATKTNECPPLSEYLKSYVTVTVSDICHNGTGELEMVPDARICGLKCRKSDGLVVLGTNMYKSVDLRCVKGSYQVKLPGKKGYKKLNRLQKLDTIRCENDDVSRWFFKDFWGTSHGNLN